jgi:hypothetical protein
MAGFPNDKEAILKMQMIQESCIVKVGFSGLGGKFFFFFFFFNLKPFYFD